MTGSLHQAELSAEAKVCRSALCAFHDRSNDDPTQENSLWWTLFAQLGADALLYEEGKSRESHPDEW